MFEMITQEFFILNRAFFQKLRRCFPFYFLAVFLKVRFFWIIFKESALYRCFRLNSRRF
jgi:hypothetical protein